MTSVAIIPARGGSKRIPKKNIKLFLGKPIIAYTIETSLNSNLFSNVIVSTDDEEIAEVAKQYGATVPFMRSKRTSGDYATTADVLAEVIEQLSMNGLQFDYACCMYPTAPFISVENLRKGFELLTTGEYDSVFPVCAYSYPVLRSLNISDIGKISMNWPENIERRSQDLPQFYHDAGQFYWINSALFISKKKLYTDNSGAIILNELEVQDIDNETDWKLAELKFQLIK